MKPVSKLHGNWSLLPTATGRKDTPSTSGCRKPGIITQLFTIIQSTSTESHDRTEVARQRNQNKTRTHEPTRKSMFTLIELLVVIAVIAILAGLLFPAFSHARKKANYTYCASNLHQISLSLQEYLIDSKDIMPYAASMPSLGLSGEQSIVDVLTENTSLTSTKVFKCPMDQEKNYYETEGTSYQYESDLGGEKLNDMPGPPLAKRFILFDFEPFHGKAGTAGSTNYLFADGHVGDLE